MQRRTPSAATQTDASSRDPASFAVVDRMPLAARIALTGRSMRRDMRLQGKTGQGRTALLVMAILVAIIVIAVLYQFVYAR